VYSDSGACAGNGALLLTLIGSDGASGSSTEPRKDIRFLGDVRVALSAVLNVVNDRAGELGKVEIAELRAGLR
jgi:hypothetical protein